MNHTHSFRNSGSRRPWFSDDFAVWGPVTQSTRRHRSECPSRPHPRPGLRAGSSALVLGTCPWWGAQGPPWGAGRAPRGQRGLRRDRREPSFAKAPSPSRVARGLRPPRPGPRGWQVCRALPASARRSSCLPRGSCPRRRWPPRQCPRHCPRGARGPDAGRRARPAFPVAGSGPAGGLALAEGASVPLSRRSRRFLRGTAWGPRHRPTELGEAFPGLACGCPRPGLSSRAACFVIRHVVATGCARSVPGGRRVHGALPAPSPGHV